MIQEPYGRRLERLRKAMANQGVDAYFAAAPASMNYLSGFRETSHKRILVLGVHVEREPVLFTPALSGQGAQNNPAGVTDVRLWSDGSDPISALRDWLQSWRLGGKTAAVDEKMPALFLLQLQEASPDTRFVSGSGVMAQVRSRKDSDELQKMGRAAQATDLALSAAFELCEPGHAERAVASALRHAIDRMEGEPAFDTMVGSGENSALPHHVTGERVLQSGDVVVLDFGAQIDGYNGDITRTVCIGEASEEARKVYEIVYEAHQAARRKIQPGIAAGEVDRAAREVIEKAGYGDYFIHRTGHGIGLEVHEAPDIVGGSQVLLEEGMCFSIEPGIYLPGKFGVRIENIVTVTADGHRSLNAEPSEILREI